MWVGSSEGRQLNKVLDIALLCDGYYVQKNICCQEGGGRSYGNKRDNSEARNKAQKCQTAATASSGPAQGGLNRRGPASGFRSQALNAGSSWHKLRSELCRVKSYYLMKLRDTGCRQRGAQLMCRESFRRPSRALQPS
jgi:hypothetical protein